jgi:hypothetical protein
MPTEQELDATAREAEQAVRRSEALIKEAEELLAKGDALRLGVTSDKVQKLMSDQGADMRAQYEKGIQEIHDEIERDAPKRQVETTPGVRVRPNRQMI